MIVDITKRILIVGLGLLGGSYARGLKRFGFHISAITKEQSSIDFALKEGIIDEGSTEIDARMIGEADLVIFALYPHIFVEWIAENQGLLKSGALITDVTGVKRSIVYKIQDILRPDVEFVAAHPMAGREVSGVENSTDRMFFGANYIVTPTEKNTPEAVETIIELGRLLGFSNVTTLSPEEHDEMIGFLSQLTHCIAITLMTCNDKENMEKQFRSKSMSSFKIQNLRVRKPLVFRAFWGFSTFFFSFFEKCDLSSCLSPPPFLPLYTAVDQSSMKKCDSFVLLRNLFSIFSKTDCNHRHNMLKYKRQGGDQRRRKENMTSIEELQHLHLNEICGIATYEAIPTHYPIHNIGRRHSGLLYTVEGEEFYAFSDKIVHAIPDSVLYIPKGEQYTITLRGEKSTVIYFDFEADNADSIRPFLINVGSHSGLRSVFFDSEHEWRRRRAESFSSCLSNFYKIISMLIRHEERYSNTASYEKISDAVLYLHAHYTDADFKIKELAKMSGRGLGHTGGTVDKFESFAGFNTELPPDQFINQVNDIGICVVGQSGNLAPCDKKLYALRDVTATVNSVPLIASSIMSKKIAAGSSSIVLDVKTGSGAFMKTLEDSKLLAQKMVDIGYSVGSLCDLNDDKSIEVEQMVEKIHLNEYLKKGLQKLKIVLSTFFLSNLLCNLFAIKLTTLNAINNTIKPMINLIPFCINQPATV